MAITTRQTTGTGVTSKNAPLTNSELDQNFIELVNSPIRFNPSDITANTTIPAGINAVSFGPLTINEDISVTIDDTSSWSIV